MTLAWAKTAGSGASVLHVAGPKPRILDCFSLAPRPHVLHAAAGATYG